MEQVEIRRIPSRSAARNPATKVIGYVRCWAAPAVGDEVECEGRLYKVSSRSWVVAVPDPDMAAGIRAAVNPSRELQSLSDDQGKHRLVLTCTDICEGAGQR